MHESNSPERGPGNGGDGLARSLVGRRAFITGASTGIGRSLAEAIVRQGGKVAALARNVDRLADLQRQFGENFLPLRCDVSDRDALMHAGEAAALAFDGLDCVIANAGVSDASFLSSGNPANWQRVIETNLIGTMVTVRATIPHFKASGVRDVVIMGSLAAFVPHPSWPAYASSKAGIAMAAECLRQELVPKNIRVALVEFGQVATEIRERSTVQEGVNQLSPLAVVPELITRMPPDVITSFVLFAIMQPESVHMNHIVIRPSGCIS
jgi:NADP-dependent 3-hydroxy acid dehydrogenase YdfG